jgi:Zn-dependent protease with chaperone function
MDGLDWEVVILRDDDPNARCFPAAGKIVVYTGTLHHSKSDVEIAVTVAHEVGHVIARHSSGIIHWLDFEIIPIMIFLILLLFPVVLPYKRR